MSSLQRQKESLVLASVKQKFFTEGNLGAAEFNQLEDLRDAKNPDFVEEIVNSYLKDSTEKIKEIAEALKKNPLDFQQLTNLIDHINGSSTSIGAVEVVAECDKFKTLCKAGNGDGCKKSFDNLKKIHYALKRKLAAYVQIAEKVKSS